MFQFHVQSQEFAEAMKKIAMAIPSSSGKGENDCIKLALYKSVKSVDKSLGLFLAFDGKVQALSTLNIYETVADVDELEIHISGKKALAAANAFAAMDTVLEVKIDKEMIISGAGNQVTLKLGQKITALKPTEPILQEIEMQTEEFIRFINFAASCHGQDKGSRGLHCVGIRIDEDTHMMKAVSSNGNRCAYAQTSNFKIRPVPQQKQQETEAGAEDKQSESKKKSITVVIEGKQLKNAVQNLTAKKKVIVGVDEKRLRIKCGTDVVMILTQDIPFPMDAVLQAISKCERVGAWKASLAKVFQSLAIYEITMETPWLEISRKSDSQIALQGKDDSTSAAVVCGQEGEIKKIVVDEREFKSSLSVFAKDQDIIIETMSEVMPLTIRQSEEDPNRIIVMPIAEEE